MENCPGNGTVLFFVPKYKKDRECCKIFVKSLR